MKELKHSETLHFITAPHLNSSISTVLLSQLLNPMRLPTLMLRPLWCWKHIRTNHLAEGCLTIATQTFSASETSSAHPTDTFTDLLPFGATATHSFLQITTLSASMSRTDSWAVSTTLTETVINSEVKQALGYVQYTVDSFTELSIVQDTIFDFFTSTAASAQLS